MSERFLQLNIENDNNHEGDWLAVNHPKAFILLYFIARRARRIPGLIDGLELGMAKIGDWEKIGLSRQNYRTALKILTQYKFVEILETNRNRKNLTMKSTTGSTTEGTLVRLLDRRIWDINIEQPNHSPNHSPNHCLTTDQPRRRKKKERIKKDISNDISIKNIALRDGAHPASPIRSKDLLTFNFEKWEFEGFTEKDITDWKLMYSHIDLQVETLKAAQWLKNNPSKNNKKQWRKFLSGWFGRANDSIENRKAYRSASGGSTQDRRTKDINGNPVDSPHTGRF
jgi:hypothetical protein